MPLSWNEIRLRASSFVNEWKEKAPKAREEADAQDFQTDFLNIFGVTRRQVATFEHRVKITAETDQYGEKTGGRRGYIDLFWKGRIIIEMKTPGKDKIKAFEQAKKYAENLPPANLPFGILISDFKTFDYYDLEKDDEPIKFTLDDLTQNVEIFGFLAGYKDVVFEAVSPVDIEAAEHMGELYDALKDNGYTGHELEMYLVRLLFCLFSDDTGIFDKKKLFYKYIVDKTNEDGSDLAMHLGQIFDILNKPNEKRLKNIDETLKEFPYVDGSLFEERLEIAAFNSKMRKTLLKCCTLDWSKIKPEIFGAMFQSVNDKEKRRALGEHYTSETNILKVIRPLFLDSLWDEFEKIKKLSLALRHQRLLEFHTKLQKLKFLDPACGCGNFLIVSYRELRLLEIEVLAEYLQNQKILDIELMFRVNVDQFYGIEIKEFPARIAQTAMWLIDHLMNIEASKRFGKYIARIPLTASPSIKIANALPLDWETLVPKNELSFILGNPPFLGYSIMNDMQKKDVEEVFERMKNFGYLDYVSCWYKKAADYIKGTNIEVSFVSTNSICQGEQVGYLWKLLLLKYNLKINFAYQTVKWSNEAKGKAAVYCVIVGFSNFDKKIKKLFVCENVKDMPKEITAKRINPYLVDADDIFIESRNNPICKVKNMITGNRPLDNGNYLFTEEEKEEFIKKEPLSKKYFKPFISAKEYINGKKRYCLWLVDANPSDLKKCHLVMERIENCRKFRTKSPDAGARKFAETPTLFRETYNPKTFLLIPRVTSENRRYIPIGFFKHNNIPSDTCMLIQDANIYDFGILTSEMHMVWTRAVCGRLKSDYRYSAYIVYNNFPWPNPTEKQKINIEQAAQEILDTRAKFANSNFASLYDPLTMPPVLLKAHKKLDKAVETAYGGIFTTDLDRISHLFSLYQTLTEGLLVKNKKGKK
jgi:hypothetical protein